MDKEGSSLLKKKEVSISFSCLSFADLGKPTAETNPLPAMDAVNKDMLEAIYANMDPTISINTPLGQGQSNCETR